MSANIAPELGNIPRTYGKGTGRDETHRRVGTGAINENTVNVGGMSGKEWILVIMLVLCFGGLVYAIARVKFYETKYEAVARELTDEHRLQRNHDDQLKIQLQAAQAIVALTRCKP